VIGQSKSKQEYCLRLFENGAAASGQLTRGVAGESVVVFWGFMKFDEIPRVGFKFLVWMCAHICFCLLMFVVKDFEKNYDLKKLL